MAIFLAVRKRHERFENSVAIFLHVAISWLFLKWLFPWLFSWLFLNFAWLFFVYVAISVAISVAIFVAIFQCNNYVYHAPQNSAYSANTKRNRKQFHDWVLQTAKFVRARLLVALDYYQQNKKHTAKPIN